MGNNHKGDYKRKFRKYLAGTIETALSLGTLAGGALISQVVADTVEEKAWLSSMKGSWSLENFTPGPGIGPIVVGIAHSDYSDAEIEAWLENQGSWSEGDLIASLEVGKRKCRRAGTMPSAATASEVAVLADGRQIITKAKWMLTTGDTVKIWAYNAGGSAIATTVPVLNYQGYANLWPTG